MEGGHTITRSGGIHCECHYLNVFHCNDDDVREENNHRCNRRKSPHSDKDLEIFNLSMKGVIRANYLGVDTLDIVID